MKARTTRDAASKTTCARRSIIWQQRFLATPILLAGFSFGSGWACAWAARTPASWNWSALALPVDDSELSYLQAARSRSSFFRAANDQFGSRANVEALFATLPEPKQLVIVDGADHFFAGKLDEVAAAIDAWLDERHPRRDQRCRSQA